MNLTKKAILAFSLLIPVNAFSGFEEVFNSIKNAPSKVYSFGSNNTKLVNEKLTAFVRDNTLSSIAGAFVLGGAAIAAFSKRATIKKFLKDTKANIYNAYSDFKEKYENAEESKKRKIKKTVGITGAALAVGALIYKYRNSAFITAAKNVFIANKEANATTKTTKTADQASATETATVETTAPAPVEIPVPAPIETNQN